LREAWGKLYEQYDMQYLREDSQQIVQDSLTGTRQIRQIVTDLKGYSHPEQQDWLHHNIHDLIESSLNIVSNQLKYKVQIQKRYQRDLPPVYCIGSQISQIIINLLVNAEQAIEEKGQITLTTSLSEKTLPKGRASVDICVTDNGSGINEEIADRIFDPFSPPNLSVLALAWACLFAITLPPATAALLPCKASPGAAANLP
ncbi:MAG: ATP-binding protein, partial [Cellvibrionaceae bacterium]|nr:ATP-binding protein [Cellvibrionaceae bacterium]